MRVRRAAGPAAAAHSRRAATRAAKSPAAPERARMPPRGSRRSARPPFSSPRLCSRRSWRAAEVYGAADAGSLQAQLYNGRFVDESICGKPSARSKIRAEIPSPGLALRGSPGVSGVPRYSARAPQGSLRDPQDLPRIPEGPPESPKDPPGTPKRPHRDLQWPPCPSSS